MFRAYFVKENGYGGYDIIGPNQQKWVCKPEDGRSRATGFAKHLERAYLEGQKSITLDVDLAVAFELLGKMNAEGTVLDENLYSILERAKRKLRKIRAIN